MQLHVQLSLPRDARYVAVMRNVATCLLRDVDAPDHVVDDLRLAVTEACANVVVHAAGVDDYSVHLTVDEGGCEVEVVDLGPGFAPDHPTAGVDEEDGRGLTLIRTLVDDLEFAREDTAMRVRLVKRWADLSLPAAPESGTSDREAPVAEQDALSDIPA